MTNFLRCKYPSSTTVPKAGKRLLETDAKFLRTWPLDLLRNSRGSGDLVSDITMHYRGRSKAISPYSMCLSPLH
ncbi:hypothetical protein LINPERHAP1_LOCUS16843 [Linum perenne]